MKKNKMLLKNLKMTWKYAREEKRSVIFYSLVSLFQCVASAFIPLASASIIINITSELFQQVIVSALCVLILSLITFILNYFKGYLFQKIYLTTLNNLQVAVADETLKLEIREIDNASSGLFIDRLTRDPADIAEVFMDIAYYLSEIVSNIGVLIVVFLLNKYIFIFLLIFLITLFIINQIRVKKEYKINMEAKLLNEKTTSIISELVRGIRDIKVLNSEDAILKKASDRIHNTSIEKLKMMETFRLFDFYNDSIEAFSGFLFLILGCFLCYKSLLTIPIFIILYGYQDKVKRLLFGFILLNQQIKDFDLAAYRVFEVLSDDTFKKEKFGDKHIKKATGDFEFKNVSFSYKDNIKVLDNISFKINANDTVAFVGKSGAGKSTIFNLLTKIYTVDEGNIYLDNIDINLLDKSSIRNNISIITQNPYIFNFSIKENLLLVNSTSSMDELIKACKTACIHEYISTLPLGYDTLVGEGGIMLSGGQRQRLAIARALLMNTEIILFDESTSSLDNQTQGEIQKAINNMKGKYTILIIAHRLSTIIDSDRILLLSDGKIKDEGTHKQLLKSSSLYRNLYKKDLLD